MGGDLPWVPQRRACPCPSTQSITGGTHACPHAHRQGTGSHMCPHTGTSSRERVTCPHRHTALRECHTCPQTLLESPHVFPHPPPRCSLPQFPQLSSPVPTRVPEGHHHSRCPRAPTCPGVAPAPPHAPKGPPGLGTHPRANLRVPYPAPTAPQSPGTAHDTSAPLSCPHPCRSPRGRGAVAGPGWPLAALPGSISGARCALSNHVMRTLFKAAAGPEQLQAVPRSHTAGPPRVCSPPAPPHHGRRLRGHLEVGGHRQFR